MKIKGAKDHAAHLRSHAAKLMPDVAAMMPASPMQAIPTQGAPPDMGAQGPSMGPPPPGYAKGGGIKIKASHKGLLHEDLGVASGKPIPEKKLEAAKNSSDPAVRKRATFAENAKHWDHKASGGKVEGKKKVVSKKRGGKC